MASDSRGETPERDFLREIIDQDIASGRHTAIVVRFPPEPNGYLHIGHAKSITLNFGLARQYGGRCNLRFDDTNPETESIEFVQAIQRDMRWLGVDWGDHLCFASDYFEQLYQWARVLIKKGKAYVDDSGEEAIRQSRGTVTRPGTESPYRSRSVDENLNLFARMRKGAFGDGTRVLRARIDMAHPNMKMRDPLMYRIRHTTHYRQGNAWCVYPFYDWAHGQSDAIEGVTHSICTLEFTVNRPLYDWYLDSLGINPRPRQYEFARLNLGHTITSKRKLRELVSQRHVTGWDDPRMPTIAGLRRRGIPAPAISHFCQLAGTTRVGTVSAPSLLDYSVRHQLNHTARRVMCVLDPLKVTLTNYEGSETISAPYWPRDIDKSEYRPLNFSRTLLINREDFRAEPEAGFRRLAPGESVRLRHACIIRCDDVVRDAQGTVVELLCTYFPKEPGSTQASPPKPRGVIHWVDEERSIPVEVRLYNQLFTTLEPGEDYLEALNPQSIIVKLGARIESSVCNDAPTVRYQFERVGYFCQDRVDSSPDSLVFGRIVTLKDSRARSKKFTKAKKPARTPSVDDSRAEAGPSLQALPSVARAFVERGAMPGELEIAAQWMDETVLAILNGRELDGVPMKADDFGRVVHHAEAGNITVDQGRQMIFILISDGGTVREAGLKVASESGEDLAGLLSVVQATLNLYPDKVEAYRRGKTGLLHFFVGQVMRVTKGQAQPALVRNLLALELSEGM